MHYSCERNASTTVNTRLCILIADGEHARLLRPDADNVLHIATSFDSASAHLASHELGPDRQGRSFESDVVVPRRDPHQMAKTKFARFVAECLNEVSADDGFDRLVLVAPAHALREIESSLDAATARKLIGKLAKDLVKVPNHALSSHLQDWIGAPHRAMLP